MTEQHDPEQQPQQAAAEVGVVRPEHGVEFPQPYQREHEQQTEKIRARQGEGRAQNANQDDARDDPGKMF